MENTRFLIMAFVLLASLFGSPADSAIVYSGRLDMAGPDFSVDLNNDGRIDFVTEWRIWAGGNSGSVNGFDAEFKFDIRFLNTELGGIHAGNEYPGTKAPLDYGELIGPVPPKELLWDHFSNDAMMWTTHDMSSDPATIYSGLWHDTDDKYLGFEISIDSNPHYGWIQLDTDVANNVALVDYAFENIPGEPIAAGVVSVPLPSTFYLLFSGVLIMICGKKIHI